jgi:glycosyltransferase involved in cell wall biosynthesis
MPPLHFAECCRECGWEPRLPGLDHGADLSQVDALVGIRSLDTRTHDRKPASKLVNAWLAGIPFIGGYDSAFAQVGTPGEDYLRVGNLEELKDALIRLREDAELYARLVQAGRQRATAHDRAAVTTAWLKFLNETAYPAFAWREESSFPA